MYTVALGSPAVRPLHRQAHLLLAGPVGDALVEAHYDVGAQPHLVHRSQFRREVVLAAVQVRAEADALVVDLAQRPHAEGLEAAAVGEDGAAPAHEAVQPAQRVHRPDAGP